MKRKTIIVGLLQHIIVLLLMVTLFREQWLLSADTHGGGVGVFPVALGAYYLVLMMRESKLLVVREEWLRKTIVFLAPISVLLLACANSANPMIDEGQFWSTLKSVVFPEFIIAFVYSFKPNCII